MNSSQEPVMYSWHQHHIYPVGQGDLRSLNNNNLKLSEILTNTWWFLDLTGIQPIDNYPFSLYAIHFWYGHV